MATDRRRVQGPSGRTAPPVFASTLPKDTLNTLQRSRGPNEIRKIFLKTGLTPSASGSAYLELEPSSNISADYLTGQVPCLKLTCTVHGPRPLPRSAPFSPQLLLSTRVKFAPFATRERRGYLPDTSERDLAAHLETALRGILIGERWPKSGIDVVVTILEGEEDQPLQELIKDRRRQAHGWGIMTVLSSCITAASAALTDAGIDCVDLITGGVAAVAQQPTMAPRLVVDPCPSDKEEILSACVIGYLQSRDELTELWSKGSLSLSTTNRSGTSGLESLVEHAVQAAKAARLVLIDALKDGTEIKIQANSTGETDKSAKA